MPHVARPEPIEYFAQTRAVLGGARLPLTDDASKMLFQMLFYPGGCDAWVTPVGFMLQFEWLREPDHSTAEIAPSMVSWLLHYGGVHGEIERCAVLYRATALPGVDGEFGPRGVWIEAMPGLITIQIREAKASTIPWMAPPLQPPVEYLAATWPCPHCHVRPVRYRVLRGDGVVCQACGASSTRPP